MRNNGYQQFFIACRIWILAVLINTFLGTIFLSIFYGGGMVSDLILFGSFFGMIVSLPALVLLFVVINRCIARKFKGITLFRIVLTSAVFLAVIAWLLYMKYFKSFDQENIYFLLIAIVSGLTATSTQYRAFIRLTDYSEPFEELQP
jgi:uncharacterized membrane protein